MAFRQLNSLQFIRTPAEYSYSLQNPLAAMKNKAASGAGYPPGHICLAAGQEQPSLQYM